MGKMQCYIVIIVIVIISLGKHDSFVTRLFSP